MLIGILVFSSCVSLEPDFTNQENYFSKYQSMNNPAIYNGVSASGYLPVLSFRSKANDAYWLNGLALTQFTGDSAYNQIELQKIGFAGGEGMAVLIYHENRSLVDVYYQKEIPLIKSEVEKMVNHAEVFPTDFDASFDIVDRRFILKLNLTDKYGRKISLHIEEKNPTNELARFIAPIGSGIDNPHYFPLLYMDDMRFVSKRDSDFRLSIGGKAMKASNVPLNSHLLTRYSFSVINAEWLPQTDSIIGLQTIDSPELTNQFADNYGYAELVQQQYNFRGRKLTVHYCPAIPDLVALKDEQQLEGRFIVNSETMEGVLAGRYSIDKTAGKITLGIKPEEGWQPMPGKSWVTTYAWKAELTPESNGKFHWKSHWERTQ